MHGFGCYTNGKLEILGGNATRVILVVHVFRVAESLISSPDNSLIFPPRIELRMKPSTSPKHL
jgi:hypothetical protein